MFVSLKLEIISDECLAWVLRSLKNDDMTPTERAIQSRIKEAFALKIPALLWDCVVEQIHGKKLPELLARQKHFSTFYGQQTPFNRSQFLF